MGAMQDVIAGMPVDESMALLKSLLKQQRMAPACARPIRMRIWPRIGGMVVIPTKT
jgi:hypothetical protein